MSLFAPEPLNPRNPRGLADQLTSGDTIRVTTTDRPRTVLTVTDTVQPPTGSPRLTLIAPSIEQTRYHCTTDADSSMMTVTEYTPTCDTSECIGTLTTIARLPDLSNPPATNETSVEVTGDD